jgi:hypothetical protein
MGICTSSLIISFGIIVTWITLLILVFRAKDKEKYMAKIITVATGFMTILIFEILFILAGTCK